MKQRYFRKGNTTFNCGVCGRNTRDTNGTNVDLCAECYEVAGIENEISDYGYEGEALAKLQARILDLKKAANAKGGKLEIGEFKLELSDDDLRTIRNALNTQIDSHVRGAFWNAAHSLTDLRDRIQRELDKRGV